MVAGGWSLQSDRASWGRVQMTSTRATEETEEDRKHAQRHRGRKVMLAYT